MNDAARPVKTAGFPWKKLALTLFVGVPLALLLGELGMRGVRRLQGRPYDSALVRTHLLRMQARVRDFVPQPDQDLPINPAENQASERLLHPYLGYEIVGGIRQIEDDWSWMKEHPDPQNKRYDILIVGGSVAQIFGQYGESTLKTVLRRDPRFAERTVRLIKYGRGGYKEPQQVIFVAYLLSLGFHFDCVLNLNGFNEVALGTDNAALGTHPIFPSIPHWGHLAVGGRTDREGLDWQLEARKLQLEVLESTDLALRSGMYRSVVLGEWALGKQRRLSARLAAIDTEYSQRLRGQNRQILHGPLFEASGTKPQRTCTVSWMESSRTIQDICNARGIDYLHALQPTLHDTDSKPLSAEELEKGKAPQTWMDGVHVGYPMLRFAGEQLRAQGVNFVDMSMVFREQPQTLYFDSCHFGQEGNDILAEAIGAALLAHMRAPR